MKEEITKAKKVSIESLYRGNLKKSGKSLIGLCPLHKDSTPSFAIYPATNSFFCFAGCGGGDVLTFYMRLQHVDFKTALKELSR